MEIIEINVEIVLISNNSQVLAIEFVFSAIHWDSDRLSFCSIHFRVVLFWVWVDLTISVIEKSS